MTRITKILFIVLAIMVSFGKEIVRITPKKHIIEYSTNGGRTWYSRYSGSSAGTFYDLCLYKNELLACTSKGVYYSTNGGRTWYSRYTGCSCGTFQQIVVNGDQLLATTSKGLYYSNNAGRTWYKR